MAPDRQGWRENHPAAEGLRAETRGAPRQAVGSGRWAVQVEIQAEHSALPPQQETGPTQCIQDCTAGFSYHGTASMSSTELATRCTALGDCLSQKQNTVAQYDQVARACECVYVVSLMTLCREMHRVKHSTPCWEAGHM